MNPLVVGYCDLTWSQSAPFVKSLRACGYRGDIIFLKGTPDGFTRRKYEEFGVSIWPVTKLFDFADVVNLLEHYKDLYTHVFGCDVRDMVHQLNLFDLIEGDDLHLFEEDFLIKEQPINCHWIRSSYGEAVFEQLKDRRIICAGAAFGGMDAMLNMFRLLRDNLKINSQATLNYLYYFDKIPALCHPNYAKLVWNVGTKIDTESDDFYEMDNHIVRERNMFNNYEVRITPAVVHQYDRHKRMYDAIKAYYG